MGITLLKGGGLAALVVALVSCAGGRSDPPTADESANQTLGLNSGTSSSESSLEKRFADFSEDVVVDKNGRVQKESKRSEFESRGSSMIGGSRSEKSFATNRYSKKEWGGTKAFGRKSYEGATKSRWNDSEYFLRKQAQEGATVSRAQGRGFRGVQNYQTANAREQVTRRIDGGSNLQSEVQQRNFDTPIKMDKSDYEQLSLQDSNNLLGR